MEWHDRFFRGLYTRVLAHQFQHAASLDHARAVRRLLRVRRGARVLDIPCGMGRVTLPLARTGLRMTGVDREPGYISRARRAATRARLRITFIRADMRDLDATGEFNAAFNWFGSFGYFSDRENLEFLRRVFRALKPGGRFLVDGPNKSFILSHFYKGNDEWIGGVRIIHRNAFDRRTGRAITRWTFIRSRQRESHTSSMRIFAGSELRALLRQAGFRDIRLYGRLGRTSFTRHSRRLIAVGRKPR
jgi:ubiquinone/menaquinone biosynthesis C-methylase UbiE